MMMKVKQVFDGWELNPEDIIDRKMMRNLWNMHHPDLQIRKVYKGSRMVISTERVEGAMHLIWTYCGVKENEEP
jgi:hypothetical protein